MSFLCTFLNPSTRNFNNLVAITQITLKQLTVVKKGIVCGVCLRDIFRNTHIIIFISNVWVRQHWYNHFLRWDPKNFYDIKALTVSPHLLWLPDVVLYNNAKSGMGAGTMYQFKTKVIIRVR